MLVLKATAKQYKSLNGFQNGVSKIEFIKDENDNWIIGMQVLTDTDFEEIKSELLKLKEIEYVEPITDFIE
jgi:hypothetical protein